MEVLDLARFQYAATTIYHFFFVPLSIGLVFLVAIMETLYFFKKKEIYLDMAKFWGNIFLISFAVGVVTGIIQEFQFGMNWSEYSRFVGDVFGVPLAIEALLAFFLESTFIGVWMFGRDRLPRWVHLLSIWLVSIGTIFSALFILAANSFMQEPVGIAIENGKAVLNDFGAFITNPQLLVEFPHTVFGAFATGAFVVAGISAFKILKKQNLDVFKKSFTIAMIVAMISGLGIAFTGHWQAQHLMSSQPMKMAASESLWEDSGDPASWSLIANIDEETRENKWSVEIPYALSILAYNSFEGSVEGMNTLQEKYTELYGEGDYIPPVGAVYWSFRIMVFAGVIIMGLATLGLLFIKKNNLINQSLYLKAMVGAIALPFIANTAGWIMTEIGRQPWTVFGLYTTAQSVSPNVTAGQLLTSIIVFLGAYTVLAVVLITLIVKQIKKGPYQTTDTKPDVDLFDKEAFGA
ncbi:cytochrome ubiquinol oxidase subunit I [Bacillus sp. D386]|uniref:cytochrome ubiquinol oxidase subunit I n=1 Tax=Bacillus sp. D386 TaxID=2587155 RepID=UPI001122794A|nr:cytochrome ubiquinol oxidase subunit I [Bacillus sp. D386]